MNVEAGFPPQGDEDFIRAVDETCREAPGVTVPSVDDADSPYNLAVALELVDSEAAGFKSIELAYHDEAGQKYRAKWDQGLELPAAGETCLTL